MDVARKSEIRIQLKHSAIHGILVLTLLGTWRLWPAALAVALAHFAIDWTKVRLGTHAASVGAFATDQAIHLAVLWAIAHAARTSAFPPPPWIAAFGSLYLKALAVVSGGLVSIFVGGIVIGMLVKPFLDEIDKDNPDGRRAGLRNAGKVIGWLERAFIVFFVLIGKPDAVGFLIAAKSILRFGEIKDGKDRKEAEYIIIGTLMSFGWALVWAWATGQALGRL